MRPQIVTVGPLATADADGICASQTPAAAGAWLLNGALVVGGVAVMDVPRRVIITAGGSETGKNVVVTGTTFGNAPASETVALPGSAIAVSTVLDYKTVTSMVGDAAISNALTVGTNGVAGSAWVRFDDWDQGGVALQTTVSGTVNYTVQQTLDDPNSPTNSVVLSAVTWVASSDSNVVSATATKQSNYQFAPTYARVLLNSQTNPGYVTGTFLQSGTPPQ